MSVISQTRTGRQLMVLDDAETIARQARRRAQTRRRRQEALRIAVVIGIVAGLLALVAGAPLMAVVIALLGIAGILAIAWQQLLEHQAAVRRRRRMAQVGNGIGTPRPKGGFSTTRHRAGAPVWVDRTAA